MAAELSPDGRHLVVLQAGYETPSLSVIDPESRNTLQRVELPDVWLGLTFNRAGDTIFVGGGARGSVWKLPFREGRLGPAQEFPLRESATPRRTSLIGDVRLDADDRTLYALDLFRDRIHVVNTQSGLRLGEIRTGVAPYRARLTPDSQHLIVSHWGEASLGWYRLSDRRLVERLPVGQHPADVLIVPGPVERPESGDDAETGAGFSARLFAACAHSDNVWTFGLTERNQFELLDVLPVAPYAGSPLGSLPSALGLNADTSELYIANAGNNTILVADILETLPEPKGVLPTGWFPTAALGLPNGGIAYLSGKGDGEHAGLAGVLPPLNDEQLAYLTTGAVENLPAPPAPGTGRRVAELSVALVFSDARGEAWDRLRSEFVFMPGYAPPATGELTQLAWLTGGMETDFFAKLGPAVAAGRLEPKHLAAAGSAALPAAGTLWSNAADASLPAETYGIAGGAPPDEWIAKVAAGTGLARLTVVRLSGTASEQDEALHRLTEALAGHRDYGSTAVFVVPVRGARGAALAGGAAVRKLRHEGFVSAPSLVRTIEWLVGLRPMTQFDQAAPLLDKLVTDLP